MNSANLKSRLLILATTMTIILASNAVSVMLFGSLGKTPSNSNWNYNLALYIFLAAIPLAHYLSTFKHRIDKLLSGIATILSGVLLGFYYGGVTANKNPKIAMTTAIIFGLSSAIGFWKKQNFMSALAASSSTICAYGLAFLLGTQALSLFSVSSIKLGIIYSIFCITYLVITIKILTTEIKKQNILKDISNSR